MPSAAQKGSYYKLRTRKWLETQGYQVAYLERVMWIPAKSPGGRPIPVKVDQFASDLLAMSDAEIIFVQVKGGEAGAKKTAAGVKAFAAFVFPPDVQRWVVAWSPRAREPEVIDAAEAVAMVSNHVKQARSRDESGLPFRDEESEAVRPKRRQVPSGRVRRVGQQRPHVRRVGSHDAVVPGD